MKTGVSYFGNRIPEHFRERDLPDIVSAGCSYVVHTFSESDLQFYRSAMEEMVAATRQAGLGAYVDPWGVGGVFAGEAFSQFLVRHPETWQVKADGVPVPAACPNNPKFQAFMDGWLEAAVALGPDVVFWDDPHLYFPPGPVGEGTDWTCHCAICRDLFHQRYGHPMPVRMSPEVVEFREETLVEFIRVGCARAKASGVRSAVGLLPFEDPEHGVMHWEKVVAIADVETLGVSPFWQLFGQDRDSFVGYWTRKLVELCDAYGKAPMVWLQAFLIEEGQEEELARTAEVAYEAGARDVAAWGYRGCAHRSAIRCARPEVVWRILGETFRALQAQG